MAKLISKCCVCGTVYAVQTCTMANVGNDEERVSHGLCSQGCVDYSMVQVMHFDDAGKPLMDRGYMVGERLYFNQEFVDCFIRINRDPVMAEMRTWDNELEFYDVFSTLNTGDGDMKGAMERGKSWARAEEMILVL